MTVSLLSEKIHTIDELAVIVAALKQKGERVVQCHGVFDLLHPGHIRHLEAARREGTILVVTVTPDRFVGKGPGRPVFNQRLRAESLAALQIVDYVAINEWARATEAIKRIKPDVYAKGSDYANREGDITGGIFEEEEAVKAAGGRLHFTDEITFSSTQLLNEHFSVYPERAGSFLKGFRQNHSADDIISKLQGLSRLNVLVIGDTIIDEYWYCEALGRSSKGTIITTRFLEEEQFAGGVLAAANHLAGFCGKVHLVTCLGRDGAYEEFAGSRLKPNITSKFFFRQDAPTVVKRRFVQPVSLAKMFEVCFIDDHFLPAPLEQEVCRYLEGIIKDYDLVLVTDFGHGFIGSGIVRVLCEQSRFLAVNTQSNSANAGYNLITRYPRADYICIDEPETRLACRDKFGKLEDLALDISKRLNTDRLIITRGSSDTLVYSKDEGFSRVPVFSLDIVDTIGAGDAFLSVTSPCVAAGYPMEQVGFIGNAVGALKVRIVCNRSPVEPVPLYKFITALMK